MIERIITSIFGDPDVKKIKQYRTVVELIKKEEAQFENRRRRQKANPSP